MKSYKTILLAFIAAVACVALAKPQRGISAADGIEGIDEASWNPTAADYVQDGLVAMWDGIENAGWGIHDELATKWANLGIEGNDIPTTAKTLFWDEAGLVRIGNNGLAWTTGIGTFSDGFAPRTVEVCIRCRDMPIEQSPKNYPIFLINSLGIRIAWRSSGAVIYTLNALVNNYESGITSTSFKASFSLVGTEEPNPKDANKNIAAFYTNGRFVQMGLYGGQASQNPTGVLFFGGSYWPNQNEIEIYSIRIYAKALTSAEVHHNYLVDRERFGL